MNFKTRRINACAYSCAMLTIAMIAFPERESGAQPPPPPPQQPPQQQPPQQSPQPKNPPGFGAALDGLTGPQQGAWRDGQDQFKARMNPGNGLGPIFNRDSCVACHSGPAIGGSSEINATRFGKTTGGVFDPLIALGGSLLQERALQPIGVEVIPSQANTTALRNTQPLFGLACMSHRLSLSVDLSQPEPWIPRGAFSPFTACVCGKRDCHIVRIRCWVSVLEADGL